MIPWVYEERIVIKSNIAYFLPCRPIFDLINHFERVSPQKGWVQEVGGTIGTPQWTAFRSGHAYKVELRVKIKSRVRKKVGIKFKCRLCSTDRTPFRIRIRTLADI